MACQLFLSSLGLISQLLLFKIGLTELSEVKLDDLEIAVGDFVHADDKGLLLRTYKISLVDHTWITRIIVYFLFANVLRPKSCGCFLF